MILYDYCRSSASYRVRIALNLKQIPYQQIAINLVTGEQCSASHTQRNAQQLVPAIDDNGVKLTQSLAICEYLDEAYFQTHQLIYGNAAQRSEIRAFALAIACETAPVNNLRVLKYLVAEMAVDEDKKLQWYQHWVNTTFTALEAQLAARTVQSTFCFGELPSLADVCLIPQIFNAKRFHIDMSAYPILSEIDRQCQRIAAFAKAHPDQQADAQ
ncbi:MAG: maleylacetoacetate isomerase [Gammaproteobacteria bacterium]|nr:maleylacetoacetate isomerase [Gammaproteobacteria bacterium]